ncbi:DoxX family protein [bacterium]|nr:DoxX family protein [bacterium]
MERRTEWGIFVLRIGLAILFLWFGFSQFFDQSAWTSWVPQWAMNITGLEAEMIVLLNGGFEIAMGVLLALGLYIRPAAILLGLHLAVLVFEIGLSPIGMRDFAIMMATFALSFLPADPYSLDA